MPDATNVKVVISAVTEAAQDAIEDVGDELKGVADDAAVGQTTLDQFSDELDQTSTSAVAAQSALDSVGDEALESAAKTKAFESAMDELGDEFDEATVKALANAGALSASGSSAAGASGSFGLLSTTLLLSLIPALFTLLSVLAPLIVVLGALAAGAVALAGAFGLVIGSGILAFGKQRSEQNKQRLQEINSKISALQDLKRTTGSLTAQQQERLQSLKKEKKSLEEQTSITGALSGALGDLKDELVPLIVSFGEQFVPLIEDALAAIPSLVSEMLNAVGGTEAFQSALRDFGVLLDRVLPTLTGLFFDLARAALPVLESLVSFLEDNGAGAIAAMQESVNTLTPDLKELLDALIEMGPVLLDFGTNAGEVVLPMLTSLIEALTLFMKAINALPAPLDSVAAGMLVLLPLFAKFSGTIAATTPTAYQLGFAFGAIEKGAVGIASALSGSLVAAGALGAGIGLLVTKLLDMLGVFAAIRDGAAEMADAMGGVIDVTLALLSIITLGLLPALAALGGLILGVIRGDLGQGVDNAKQILAEFGQAFGNTWDMIKQFFRDLGSLVGDFVKIGRRLVDAIIDGIVGAGPRLLGALADQLAIAGVSVGDVLGVGSGALQAVPQLQTGGFIESSGLAMLHEGEYVIPPEATQNASADAERGIDTRTSPGGRDTGPSQQTVVRGGVNVNVERGEFGRNPRDDSRTLAEQLRRELRSDSGST